MHELRESELLQQRKADKRDHLLKHSPSILAGLSRIIGKKQQAVLSLEDAEREEAELLEKQRVYNQLLSERDTIAVRLQEVEKYSESLTSGIKGWQQTVLDHLFAFDAHSLDRSAHAAIQITLLRTRLELLPIAVKELKAKQTAVKAEITALEKTIL